MNKDKDKYYDDKYSLDMMPFATVSSNNNDNHHNHHNEMKSQYSMFAVQKTVAKL